MAESKEAEVKAAIEKLLAIDKDSLISRPGWGDIKFEGAAAAHESIYEIVGILAGLPYARLPEGAANQVIQAIDRVYAWIKKNNDFTLNVGNPSAERDQIVQNLINNEKDLYQNTQQWIPFLAYLKGDIPKQLANIETSVLLSNQKAEDFENWLGGRRGEFDKIIQATREASAKAGVGVFTQDFLDEGIARESDAKSWLVRSSISAIATVLVAFLFFFGEHPTEPAAIVQYATSKIVILTMFIGITAWCAGNYKANKHQATVNRYKAHALRTFQAFVQASDNPSVRDAVLMETTRAIFAQSQSGYLRTDVPADSGSKIVEIIKGGAESAAQGHA